MRSIAAAFVLVMTLVSGAGLTGAATPTDQATIRDRAVSWLESQVTPEGALVSSYTGTASPGITAQGVLALAGAGGRSSVVDSMIAYLQAHVGDYVAPGGSADSPGALAWLILDAVATGNDPNSFGGVDLVTRLRATQRTGSGPDAGLFGSADPTYDGAFRQGLSLMALAAVGQNDPTGLAWLQGQQCADGAFVAYRADTTVACPAVDPSAFSGPDTNSTAFAAIALHLAGDNADAGRATAWLDGVRTPQGGFAYLGSPTLAMDGNSTGLVLAAFTTVDGAPDAAAVAALGSLQAPPSADAADRGGIAFQPQGTDLAPDLMATVQALIGLAGQALPFHPAPVVPTTSTTTTSTTSPVSPSKPAVAPGAAAAQPVIATPAYTG